MPRPATGQIRERQSARGIVYGLRFRACGQRQSVTLGAAADGWTRARAEEELQNVLADVRRGLWRPPAPTSAPPQPNLVSFHEFASDWFAAREREWRTTTRADYRWRLTDHLLPFFADYRLADMTVAAVDAYRDHKLREGALSAESINKTLTLLGQVLDVAEERDLVPRNPMRVNPRRRKLRVTKPRPIYLDSAVHVAVLLEAAAAIDARRTSRTSGRRALVAALVLAGLRASEAAALTWRDVDLAGGRLHVGRSKTDAGVREVDMLPLLRDELTALKAAAGDVHHDAPVFPTAAGGHRDKDNIARRVMAPVVAHATELLGAREERPLPLGLTAHKLRHTFASILTALGRDPSYVMGQLGHSDPKFTLRVYSHIMRRDEGEREALRALVEGDMAVPDAGRDSVQEALNGGRPMRVHA
jgi:integrase